VPRVSTHELYSAYTVIGRNDLDVGDILVKPGSHVVLVVEREDATHALIWESTSAVNGCRERSIDFSESAWDAYYPRRCNGLAAGTDRRPRDDPSPAPMRPFPAVLVTGNRVVLQATFPWRGIMSLHSLRGEVVRRLSCRVDAGETAGIPLDGAAGTRIVRLESADGGEVAGVILSGYGSGGRPYLKSGNGYQMEYRR
jgi:hypothetical protein